MIIQPVLRDVLRSPSGDFSPADLPGLKLWARKNKGITVTGQGVSQWDDQSGNGNHLLQSTNADRPRVIATGVNLVSNGDFPVNTTGWTAAGGAVLSVDAGRMKVLNGAASNGYGFQVIATVIGETYYISANGSSGGTAAPRLVVGTSQFGSQYGTYQFPTTGATAPAGLVFTATTTTCWVTAALNNTTINLFMFIDDIAVRKLGVTDGILLDGISDYLTASAFTLVQPETVYLLVEQVTWTASDALFDGNASLSMLANLTPTTPDVSLYAGTGNAPTSSLALVGTEVVFCAVFNGAASVIQVNNTSSAAGNPGASNAGGFTLGARGGGTSYANILVKEIAVFAAGHGAVDRQKMANYLAKVGGLLI